MTLNSLERKKNFFFQRVLKPSYHRGIKDTVQTILSLLIWLSVDSTLKELVNHELDLLHQVAWNTTGGKSGDFWNNKHWIGPPCWCKPLFFNASLLILHNSQEMRILPFPVDNVMAASFTNDPHRIRLYLHWHLAH